jgi:dipeptidase E
VVLTSNGLSSQPLFKEIKKYITADMKTAAMITTASVGYKEKDRHVPKLTEELESLNLSVDYFDLDTQQVELLRQYDVIELIGGNPFYLLKRMKSKNCLSVFHELIERKIVIGISAGSLVLQKSLTLIAQYSPELNEEVKLTDFSGLNLTDVEILPHYKRFKNQIPDFEKFAKKYEEKNNCNLIRIDDGQGVFISEGMVHII